MTKMLAKLFKLFQIKTANSSRVPESGYNDGTELARKSEVNACPNCIGASCYK
jgi:hypothetical protein